MLAGQQEQNQDNDRLRLELDRGTVVTGVLLIAIAGLAWIEVVYQSMGMRGMEVWGPGMDMGGMMDPGMGMATTANSLWGALASALAYLCAWCGMMAAMMLPSATPMIALYGAGRRNSSQASQKSVPTAL